MTTNRLWRILALLAAFGFVAAACGNDSGTVSSSGDPTASETETTSDSDADADADEIVIVSLSPTATEMLFAIGAGDLVIAADDYSNFPTEAPTTELSGFEPNLEAIAAYEPTIVIGSFLSDDIVSGLEGLGIDVEVYAAATTLDEAFDQVLAIGELTGHEDEAAAVVEELRAAVATEAALVPERDEPLTYYYELDPTFYSVTSETFVGEIMSLAGMVSIADAVEDDSFGYPQLSEEFIIDANPDVILNACSKFCGTDAGTIAARPGWDTMAAVQNGLIIDLDDDIASRWGPRVVELLHTVVKATASA